MEAGSTQTADDSSLVVVDDDVGSCLALSNGGGELQLVHLLDLGVGALITLDAEAGDAALQASIVAFVLDECAHLQQEDLGEVLVDVLNAQVGVVVVLLLVFHGLDQTIGDLQTETDDALGIGQDLEGVALDGLVTQQLDVTDTADGCAQFLGLFFNKFSCDHELASFPYFVGTFCCFPLRSGRHRAAGAGDARFPCGYYRPFPSP